MSPWTRPYTIALAAVVIAMPAVSISLFWHGHALLSWLSTVILMVAFLMVVGVGVMRRPLGIFIDERNLISLARFQMVVWTVVVLSGYFTAVMGNVASGAASPLAVAVPTQLWILMGIGTTSLVGSPLILSIKMAKTPDPMELAATKASLAQQGDAAASVSNKGNVIVNTAPSQARLSDMLTGEETGNAAHLDVARIQMFFFTLIVVLVYCAAIGRMFLTAATLQFQALPELDQSVTALLGISHAGYLTSKSVSHSQQA